MSFRRLTTLIVFLVCGAGVALWLAQNFVNTWEPELRSHLENGLSQSLHERVHVGSVSLSFFNRFSIHDVQIWSSGAHSQLIFRTNEISLTLSFIDLPGAIRRQRPLESIGLIEIHQPYLDLSPEILTQLRSGRNAPSALPLLFTLAWEEGTLHWTGTTPEESLMFSDTKGAFRIRGPKMDFALRAHVPQSPLVRLEYSSFGSRWNARALVTDADIPGTLALAQTFLHRSFLPVPWQVQGNFTLELLAGGRHLPSEREVPWSYLQKGHLAFSRTSLTLAPGLPPIFLNGALENRETRWFSDGLKIGTGHSVFKVAGNISPFPPNAQIDTQITGHDIDLEDISAALGHPSLASGRTEASFSARGLVVDPILDLQVKIPDGHVKLYPLKDADINAHYEKHAWTLSNATAHLWGGLLQAKGTFGAEKNDLKISGENLSLAQALPVSEATTVDGLLNFSGNLAGSLNEPEATGSVWVSHLTLGSAAPVDARGDIDVTSDHLETEMTSDDRRFQFSIAGDRDEDETNLSRMHVVLPDGSSADGNASFSSKGSLKGEFTAKNVPLPGLFAQLARWTPGLAGTVNAHLLLGGHVDHPTFQGTLDSQNLTAGGEALGATQVEFSWADDHLKLPSFHVGSKIHGSLQTASSAHRWTTLVTVKESPVEPLLRLIAPKATVPGTLTTSVELNSEGLDLQNAHFTGPNYLADAHGKATWSEHLQFDVDGRAWSSQAGPLWEFPFQISGHGSPKETNSGEAHIRSPMVLLRQKPTDPFEATVEWDHSHVGWSQAHWGNHWRSDGSLHLLSTPPTVAAHLDFTDAPASVAARWLGWEHSEEIDGALTGSCQINGTLTAPSVQINSQLKQGRWRAFHFDSTINGEWKQNADSTLAVNGTFEKGRPFSFQGQIHPNSTVNGHLQVDGLNLTDLGTSLSFPQPLSGLVRGTLEVQGPWTQPQLVGHIEGSPTVYGAPDKHPFRLEHYFLDVSIAPSPDLDGFTRVTISKGIAKTAEEEIRLHPGSYAEFAAGREARLQLGTDLRNLHLGIFTLFGGLDLDGTWQIKPAGLEISGDVTTRSLFINDYELQQGHVDVDYYDNVLKFTPPPHAPRLITGTMDFHNAPQLKFTNFLLSGLENQGLELTGDIGPSHWDFHMSGKGLDMGTLSGLAGFPYPLSGTADLSVRGTGDFTHPHLEGSINLSNGSALGLNYTSGQAAFVWQNDRITFTQLMLTDPGRYKLIGSGGFPLIRQAGQIPSDPNINFSVRLVDSNLSLLQSLSSEVKKARGDVQGLLQITGTSTHPLLAGSLRVTDGDVLGAHYFHHLQNLLLSVDFSGNKVLLRELQGDSGNGTFLAEGQMTLNGFVPSAYDLRADITSAKGLSVQVPELAIPESPLAKRFHFLTTISQADVKGHVTFKGPADAPTFKGQATIANGHFTFPPSQKNPPPPELLDWFRRINWDVGLTFQDGAWFENEYVQASLAGKLGLLGPSDGLRVDGGMDITQGEISYLGLQFDIKQARFDIISKENNGLIVNTPYVSGVADSNVQATDTLNGSSNDVGNRLSFNDTITLTIDRAPVDEIKPRLTSANNPNLSQDKVLARATQIDTNDLTPQERTYLYQQQMIQIIDTSLAGPLAKNFLKRTGLVDNFRVEHVTDPSGVSPIVGAANTPSSITPVNQNPFANTKYTVEKDLFNRVTVGYGVRFVPVLTPDLQDRLNLVSDVQLSYRWFKNVYVKADADLPNSNPSIIPERKITIEPTFRFGWWGNTNAAKPKTASPVLPAGPSLSPLPAAYTPATSSNTIPTQNK